MAWLVKSRDKTIIRVEEKMGFRAKRTSNEKSWQEEAIPFENETRMNVHTTVLIRPALILSNCRNTYFLVKRRRDIEIQNYREQIHLFFNLALLN